MSHPLKSFSYVTLFFAMAALMVPGCVESQEAIDKRQKDTIMGKKTSDIGEAGKNDAQADMQVKQSDGLKALPGAYGFAVSQLAKGQIKQMVELYRAEHGNYPKTHEVFMREIIQKYKIELPVLPGGRAYKYDVKNHELIVVDGEKKK